MPVHRHQQTGLRFEISELPKPHYEKEDYCVVFFSKREAEYLKGRDDFKEVWQKKLENPLYSPLDQAPFDPKDLLKDIYEKLGAK